MVQDLLRDSTIGQIVNYLSSGRLLPYPEQRPDYVVPKHFLKNWSFRKRAFVAFEISFLTFSIYIGSAIYTSSTSLTTATLGLTLYILAYGIGPMFLSPLQELPFLGRNPVYMATLFLFVVFQIPIVTATNISTVLAMRFMTGFFGSPALTPKKAKFQLGVSQGASMADIFPQHQFAYVLGIWALGAVAGPITGPVIGGFAAQAESWRWPMMEFLWITSFAVVFLSLLLPETYGPTILLRRAERLRKFTGNPELRTAEERDEESKSAWGIMYESLVRPFLLAKEPALAFANIYLGFTPSSTWFEAFPLVFIDIYHFNQGASGLPFLAFIVSGGITYTVYCIYQKSHIAPRYARAAAANTEVAPEIRLEIGLMASIFIPASVLIFGFSSKPSVHWIVPSILMYVTSAYPAYAASVLAGNDLFRSTIASVFPLFGRTFFTNLGLGPGSALLAGISFLLMPVFWLLLKYGHVLRQRSKYAHSP
ncbi:major facilitator superfamily domain-containing protein [Mycena vitilis]|nr:major facilitator superfamily domain-containing protein [Mycena vitilis]